MSSDTELFQSEMGPESEVTRDSRGPIPGPDGPETSGSRPPPVFIRRRVEQNPKLTVPLVAGTVSALVGGALLYGYNIGIVNGPSKSIKKSFFPIPDSLQTCYDAVQSGKKSENLESCQDDIANFTAYQDDQYSMITSTFAVGGLLGAVFIIRLSFYIGKLGTLMAGNVLSFLAALLLGLSREGESATVFIIGRLLIGLVAGLSSALVPVYLTEITPLVWRRNNIFFYHSFYAFGILLGQIMASSEVLGGDTLWQVMFACTCIPSAFSLSMFGVMPEVKRGPQGMMEANDKKAEKAIQDDPALMRNLAYVRKNIFATLSFFRFLTSRFLRSRVIAFTIIMLAHQLCGVNAIFYYGDLILVRAGIKEKLAHERIFVVFGVVYFVVSAVSAPLYRTIKSNNMLSYGYAVLGFWFLLLASGFLLQRNHQGVNWMSFASCIILICYLATYACTVGPAAWMVVPMMFPPPARPAAFMYGCLMDWLGHIIVARSFLPAELALGFFIYIGYSMVCLLAFAVASLYVPSGIIYVPNVKPSSTEELRFEPEEDSDPSEYRTDDVNETSMSMARRADIPHTSQPYTDEPQKAPRGQKPGGQQPQTSKQPVTQQKQPWGPPIPNKKQQAPPQGKQAPPKRQQGPLDGLPTSSIGQQPRKGSQTPPKQQAPTNRSATPPAGMQAQASPVTQQTQLAVRPVLAGGQRASTNAAPDNLQTPSSGKNQQRGRKSDPSSYVKSAPNGPFGSAAAGNLIQFSHSNLGGPTPL